MPDNGFFAANSYHPDIQLQYGNSDNGNNLHLIKTSTGSFNFSVPNDVYSQVHIVALSTEGSSNMSLRFTYSDGTFADTGTQTVPDWFDEITESTSRYYLINSMDRASPTTRFDNANDPALFGLRFDNPQPSKTVTSMTVNKANSSGFLSVFGANGIINYAAAEPNLSVTSIDENVLANTGISTLSSTDPDAGSTFSYSLVSGSGDTDNAAFTIVNGNQLSFNNAPDFETKSSYNLRVLSTDAGGLGYDKALTININDLNEAPTDISLSATSINENASANTVIGTLGSTDPDAGNTHSYALIPGASDTDNAAFSIVNNELRINNAPDFETKSSYNLRVLSTDAGGLSYSKALTINTNDLNEAPTIAKEITKKRAYGQTEFNFAIPANTFTDPESNPLTYTATLESGTALPDWLTLSNGTFNGTPSNSDAGTLKIQLTATDNSNLSTPTTFDLAVASMKNGTTANDKLIGDNNDNVIYGGGGNDTITGGGGSDTIDGGVGTNTANYLTSTTGVFVDLMTGMGYIGDAENDILTNIQNLRGSNYGDVLIGDNNTNYLYGEAGKDIISGAGGTDYLYGGIDDDIINGGTGNDSLYGEAGNDTINGDDGNDILTGGSGADVLDGGIGTDTATYSTSTAGVVVNFATGTGSGGEAQGDALSNMENLTGSKFNDALTGNSGNNVIYGNSGNDTIFAGGGNDTFYGGDGIDILTGASLTKFGVGEIDILTGNAGADSFVLGTNAGVLYNDGVSTNAGLKDYARILDFNVAEDVVQLTDGLSYYLGAAPTGTYSGSGTGIFIDNDGTAGLSTKDELIGVLQGVTLAGAITAGTPGFTFV
ncbi:MAG TPA: putative Ig domain-containing protein [Oculatellaceae cyanobacterium]